MEVSDSASTDKQPDHCFERHPLVSCNCTLSTSNGGWWFLRSFAMFGFVRDGMRKFTSVIPLKAIRMARVLLDCFTILRVSFTGWVLEGSARIAIQITLSPFLLTL